MTKKHPLHHANSLPFQACRRHKRLRSPLSVADAMSFNRLCRTTPAHLSSSQAEVILAQACHNETQAAKRRHLEAEAAQMEGAQQLMQVS